MNIPPSNVTVDKIVEYVYIFPELNFIYYFCYEESR